MSQKNQIFKLSILRKLLDDENSCVSLMQSTRLLALPPFYLHDMKLGILYLLNSMLKKYDRTLGGIVMGYQNIKVLMDENTGIIPIGTSEIEVNVSVDFYIFQPKIGSYLEGVINKKSNSHIGCLVHQYFNATILKPEDVLYEDWNCKNFNVDDKIIFKVKDLDFTTLLPLIEGIYDGKNSLEVIKSRPHKNCDTDHMIISDVNKSSQNEESVSTEFSVNADQKSNIDFSNIKKCKQELNEENEKLSNDFGESQSLRDLKPFKKKKKKKKEEIQFSSDCAFKVNEDSNHFVKVNNSKLEIRKKKYQNEEPFPNSDKTNECLPSQDVEDNVLYSTQLEPNFSSKKMRISFCSPIPWNTSFEEKVNAGSTLQNVESSLCSHSQDIVLATEKEVKKKHKKRKREKQEESENSTTAKKTKMSYTSASKEEEAPDSLNSNPTKSILEIMMEQLNQSSKPPSLMHEKIKKEAKKKKIKEERNKSFGINEERKSDAQSTFSELCIHELNRVKEELSKSNKESFKKSKKTKVKLNKHENLKDMTGEESYKVRFTPNVQINCTNGSGNKSILEGVRGKLCKQEIDRENDDIIKCDIDNIKEKKRYSMTSDPEASRERTHLLLYDKLLNDAKSAIDLENYQKMIRSPGPEWKKKKKSKDILDLSTSSSGKKDSKKEKGGKTEGFRKTENSGEKEESLYEKLLRQAKSLIDDGEVSLIKNKEKKGKKKKRK